MAAFYRELAVVFSLGCGSLFSALAHCKRPTDVCALIIACFFAFKKPRMESDKRSKCWIS
jgi:hypothetical protein